MNYGRKFWLAVAAFATFTALLVVGKIDQGAYVTLSLFALGGYLGANVIQKATAKKATDA
jgi:hypothetical protein